MSSPLIEDKTDGLLCEIDIFLIDRSILMLIVIPSAHPFADTIMLEVSLVNPGHSVSHT